MCWGRPQAREEAGQAKARLGVCERELSLARQDAEGSMRSGEALSTELHALTRQNAALQHQVASLEAQLEETLNGHQTEVHHCQFHSPRLNNSWTVKLCILHTCKSLVTHF